MTEAASLRFPFSLAERLGGPRPLILALALFLVTPGHPQSHVRGLPLDPLVTAVMLPAGFLLWAGWRSPPNATRGWLTVALLFLTLAKVWLSLGAPEPGAVAAYYGRARLADPPERSLDFRHLSGATRIDRILDFNQWSLPVHFFNDNDRFNFYEPSEPDRQRLPVSAIWTGWLTVPEARTYRLWLTAIGDAAASLDGVPILQVTGGRSELALTDARPMDLEPGAHELRLEYTRRAGQITELSLDWDGSGDRAPVGPRELFTTPAPPVRLAIEGARGAMARSVDLAGLLVFLAAALISVRAATVRANCGTRTIIALWAAAITLYGVLTSQDLIGHTIILEGGQDWLTYEYYARDILLNGPLMTLGKALGQGRAFAFQPLYPYYLSALHGVLGEGLFGPQVAHFAGFGVMGIAVFGLARTLFGNLAAWVSLALSTMLVFTQLDVVARRLLSENLYFFVLPVAILAVILAGRSSGWKAGALAGILVGIACLTRAPTLLIVPVAVLTLVLARRPRALLAMLLLTVLVVGLAPLRNYVVSGRPALVATNAGATLLLAHPPTERVRLRGLDQHPVYNRLGIDRQTREVVEFVIQDPVGYAATLVPLAAYTLGFPGPVEPETPPQWDLVILVLLYLVALGTLQPTRQRETWVSHAFIASHFLVMITFLPYVYGYRQVLPMYVIMLPICAAVIAQGLQPFVRSITNRPGVGGP